MSKSVSLPFAERPEVSRSACFSECGSLVDRSSCTEASFVGRSAWLRLRCCCMCVAECCKSEMALSTLEGVISGCGVAVVGVGVVAAVATVMASSSDSGGSCDVRGVVVAVMVLLGW